jgi:hypothetical protein
MTQTTNEIHTHPIEIVDQPEEETPDQRLTLLLMILVTLVSATVTFLVVRRLLNNARA